MKDLLTMKKELEAKLDAVNLLLGDAPKPTATTKPTAPATPPAKPTTKPTAKTKTKKRRTGHVGPRKESIAAKTRAVVAKIPIDTLFTVDMVCHKLNLYRTKRNRKTVVLELDRMRKRGEVVRASNPYEIPTQYMKG